MSKVKKINKDKKWLIQLKKKHELELKKPLSSYDRLMVETDLRLINLILNTAERKEKKMSEATLQCKMRLEGKCQLNCPPCLHSIPHEKNAHCNTQNACYKNLQDTLCIEVIPIVTKIEEGKDE